MNDDPTVVWLPRWVAARLLAYIEATTDADAVMDEAEFGVITANLREALA